LISGDLDADRVEYVLRDSYLTGASIGSAIGIGDIERILDNMKIIRSGKDYVLAFDEKARANLEGFIIARFNIYKLVYLHHKVVLFNTLARSLLSELLRHYDELNDDIKDYLCQLYHFSIGHLRGYDVMYIIDDYLLSILLRNRQYLINRIRGISKFLDPLITRSTTFKALWKRDFEFIN
ncbi:MAG: HD domain-containing protein, partial [Vulcanisaeta sp.]